MRFGLKQTETSPRKSPMPSDRMSGRHGDGSTKWLVGGVVASLGMGAFFLAFMADQMRVGGAGGPGPLMIVAMLGAGMFGAVALGPIGKAIGKRLLDGGAEPDTDLRHEMEDLRLQGEDLRQALAEAQERLDFTERMIAGGREGPREELH